MGIGLTTNTNVTFATMNDSGVPGTQSVRVAGINIDGTQATVVVPTAATTGSVAVPGTIGSQTLQIVPRVWSFVNNDFRPSGSSRSMTLYGNGFLEGGITVNYGSVPVVDPNVSSGTIDVYSTNTAMSAIIPSSAGGDITLTTNGGTSNVLTVGPTTFTGITASATHGTPASGGSPSANAYQTITLTGSGFAPNTNLIFTTKADDGTAGTQAIRVSGVAVGGTHATVVVPPAATTGTISMPGTGSSYFIQIVPRLTSYSNTDFKPSGSLRNLVLRGNGFVEGGITVDMGAVSVVDPNISNSTIDVYWTNTGMSVIIPSGAGSDVSVTTTGGTSNSISVATTSFTGITASSNHGTPASGAVPSANAGQQISVTGTGFKTNSNVTFSSMSDTGIAGTATVRISGFDISGTVATVAVPYSAVTGPVTMPGTIEVHQIQIVPRLNSFTNNDFRPSGSSKNMRLHGSGFVEGGTTVDFGGVPVVDPDSSNGTMDIFWTNTTLDSVLPGGLGADISVSTAGGTSDILTVGPTSFTGVEAVATYGTPVDSGILSANVGQRIKVIGTGLRANSNVNFKTMTDGGIPSSQSVRLSNVNSAGTEATVVVPTAATTGDLTMPGAVGQHMLQVVPRLTSFSFSSFNTGANVRFRGSAFVEGGTTINFGAVPVVDPNTGTSIVSVFWTNTGMDVTIPSGAEQSVTIETAGGTSNAVDMFLPTSAISSPKDGDEVAEDSIVDISTIVIDGTGIQSVDFYVDGSLDSTDVSSPFTAQVTAPSFDPAGTNDVTLFAVAHDTDGNAATSTPITVDVVVPQLTLVTTASYGTPTNPGVPSANIGQIINLSANFRAFNTQSKVIFQTANDSGVTGTTNINVSYASVDGKTATVVVPSLAVSGDVTVTGVGTQTLQVVPRLWSFSNNTDYRPGQFLRLVGNGFVEGAVTVHMGSVDVVDPDTGSGVINVHASATGLDLYIPTGAGSNVSVETTGGISETVFIGPESLTDLIATATYGTPSDSGIRSANVGQTITLIGTGFRTNTNVAFPKVDDSGNSGTAYARVKSVSQDRTQVTVVVPNGAVTGLVRAQGLTTAFNLQIVPRLWSFSHNTSYAPGQFLRLTGNGFVEGAVTVHMGSVSVVDPSTSSSIINVHASATNLDVYVPSGAGSALSVETAGGISKTVFVGPETFTDLLATATYGTSTDLVERSANVGQTITLVGSGFRTNTNVTFTVSNDNSGATSTAYVLMKSLNETRTEATVLVPNGAITGPVGVLGLPDTVFLQIVPRLWSFSNNTDYKPGTSIRLIGNGFAEGAIEVHLGAVGVIDPSNTTSVINVHQSATRLDLSIPTGAGSDVSVQTAGGTSETVFIGPLTFIELTATATHGTSTDISLRSANTGQRIVITGSGFRTNMNVQFPGVNDSGVPVNLYSRVVYVNADGTEATVVVPNGAVTGDVSLFGLSDVFYLQIVPRITSFSFSSFTAGSNLRLNGGGFVEGDMTVNFGSVPVVDPSTSSTTINVHASATRLDVRIPSGAETNVSVTTVGGTSETVIVN